MQLLSGVVVDVTNNVLLFTIGPEVSVSSMYCGHIERGKAATVRSTCLVNRKRGTNAGSTIGRLNSFQKTGIGA